MSNLGDPTTPIINWDVVNQTLEIDTWTITTTGTTGIIPTTIQPLIQPIQLQPLTAGSLTWYNQGQTTYKPRRSRLSTAWEKLKEMSLSALDKCWMINFSKDYKEAQKEVPPTVLRKLMAKGLIEIKLTPRGEKEAICYSFIGPEK